jgi:hypothetical protein
MSSPRKVKVRRLRIPTSVTVESRILPPYSPEFIIGSLMGEIAWQNTLPTLSHDPCQSGVVLQVSEEDVKFQSELSDIWYKTKKKSDWDEYQMARKLIAEKYLPKEVTHKYEKYIEVTDEVKNGLISYLWNTDGCNYSCDANDIIVTNEIFMHFTKVTFIYK